jgi:hypothetical protein
LTERLGSVDARRASPKFRKDAPCRHAQEAVADPWVKMYSGVLRGLRRVGPKAPIDSLEKPMVSSAVSRKIFGLVGGPEAVSTKGERCE